MSSIVHHYYKKSFDGLLILVQLDPVELTGVELLIDSNGQIVKSKRQYDSDIYSDLEEDNFVTASALEFNLYLKGLVTT